MSRSRLLLGEFRFDLLDLTRDLFFGRRQFGARVRERFAEFLDFGQPRTRAFHHHQQLALETLIVFLERIDLMRKRLQLLVVADQVLAHPLVAQARFAFRQLAFELFSRGGGFLLFGRELLEVRLLFGGLVA